MVTCHICKTEVGADSQNKTYHDTCGDEWRRRRAEGKCVRCDAEYAMQNRIWCARCRDTYKRTGEPPPWLGYPEGG